MSNEEMHLLLKNVRQKKPSRGGLNKRYSENMQQIYRRTSMLKCDFNNLKLLKVFIDGFSKGKGIRKFMLLPYLV